MSAMANRTGLIVAVAVAALAAFGCAGNEQGLQLDGGQGPNTGCTQPALFMLTPQVVTVAANGSADLQVRYACGQDPYEGAVVSFAISGDPQGSQLSAVASQTDSTGAASVTVRAGALSAAFQVTASAEGATTLVFDVRVSAANTGTILVSMNYAGQITYTEFKAYLFQGRDCAALDPFALPIALQEAVPVTSILANPQFINLPAGQGYAVGVTAKRQGELLGFGCTGALTVHPAQITDADVAIFDIPITFSGTYDLDNHFDMSGLLPGSVANAVHLFDEMSDDHAVEGDLATDQWGVDPAAFLLDFVYRQFCKWECTNANPSWDNCTPGTHPTGDLKETYRGLQGKTPFMSWDGDQPRYQFLCGMLDPTWGMTQIVQDEVQSRIPTRMVNILDTVGDVARAIDKMHVTSKLTLNDVRPGRQGNFSHVLQTMIVDLHDLQGTLHTFDVDLAQAGVGNLAYTGNTTVINDELQIPEHSFQLKFGKLVQYIYLNYLLPLLGCAAPNNTTACLFQQIVDCQSVGTWLYDACDSVAGSLTGGFLSCPISATQFGNFCTAGLNIAGSYIDTGMASWIGDETQFSLHGEASAGEVDTRRVATTLKDGVWVGTWLDNGGTNTFPGSFTGVRE